MRIPRPWLRKSTRLWFVQLDGRQVPLGPNKQEALRKFHVRMAGRRNGHSIGRIDELFDEYLEHVQRNGKDGTYRLYKHYLSDFNRSIPNKRVHDLCPHDVQRWLDGKEWSPTTRKIVVKTIKGAFNWATRQGLIPSSPLIGLKAPAALSRDVLISPEQWQQIAKEAKAGVLMRSQIAATAGCSKAMARRRALAMMPAAS